MQETKTVGCFVWFKLGGRLVDVRAKIKTLDAVFIFLIVLEFQ